VALTVKRLGQMNMPTIRSTIKPTKAVMGAVTTLDREEESRGRKTGRKEGAEQQGSRLLTVLRALGAGVCKVCAATFALHGLCACDMGQKKCRVVVCRQRALSQPQCLAILHVHPQSPK
jgi:hypothetical protein